MKQNLPFSTRLLFYLIAVAAPFWLNAQSGVFNPNDPVVNYNSASPPVKPGYNQVGKWVRTPKVSWNTTSFKCYYFNGLPFRLKFPKNYDSTKNYPVIIFFNGDGEYGRTPYDNEYQLALGGQVHMAAVDNGKFNGFLLYPQSQSPYWYAGSLGTVKDLLEKVMIPMNMIDPFRIYIDGLSAGGQAVWQFMQTYTTLVAAATPISAASPAYDDSVLKYRFTPVWHFQGGQDPAPLPSTSHALGGNILKVGGNYQYTEFPS
ncbi:MAG TPA: hypothetical protein VNS32_01205, partial [Flavisolibacter sp.]|nr:hypothetical protein [Flavisolibacter sp.]